MRGVALLRGINVGARNKIPMSDLRSLCEGLGWSSVVTHLQTGNVAFNAAGRKAGLEATLEQAIASELGVSVPVIVRDAKTIAAYLDSCPLGRDAEREPSRTLLYVTKLPVAAAALEALRARAQAGEQVSVQRDCLWIHFSKGVAGSKLSPRVIDKAVGSPATGRNWNTMSKVRNLLQASV